MISPEQIRAGRALLGITQSELAERAGISTTGLNNIERGNADPKASTLRAIEAALSEGGVIFLSDGQSIDGGPGVRLAKRKA
ncbi:helix-turn-helix domain-containing protein [Bradyrhizobium barranii]|uniref:Helix-turn-helix domain-containing protein n=1 Tax=Bradyrhizobium barranii TaxID=2992140 RepID=A0ABY3QAQ5_9BRAD|nr:helix-turn-helix transcriptional regulator [Bradyrhizobium japonicum]UFW82890.1 helix-turn-helix domain-containing protein [Bradyrhizobium japonicum]